MDDNSPKEQKDKRKRANGSSKKGNKKSKIVKLECIDEVASVEAMKEVEKKLWLEHYNQLCENCRRSSERNVLVVKQTNLIN